MLIHQGMNCAADERHAAWLHALLCALLIAEQTPILMLMQRPTILEACGIQIFSRTCA